jgi:hypothetical protein
MEKGTLDLCILLLFTFKCSISITLFLKEIEGRRFIIIIIRRRRRRRRRRSSVLQC